ncbi:MAG: hypothetical protein PHV99_00300 [Candidatus Pacebacteria bacterium]|nr:hypothetical protein [Candidatus Paceibacterota bacterium]
MRSRTSLFALLLVAGLFIVPAIASAQSVPFFGPIIPQEANQGLCPASWGMVIIVINRIIAFMITLAIVFVAPLMIAYSGFLFVVNPVNASGKEKAKEILRNTVIGIVIALSGWMIVDALMAVLYNPGNAGGTWMTIIRGNTADVCLPQKGALPSGTLNQTGTVTNVGVSPGAATGRYTFDPGIAVQTKDESGPLSSLLSCMAGKLPAGVGRISSISDSLITSGQKTFAQCATGGCQHQANSCHYGGKTCIGSSYAVDFGDDENITILTAAAKACGAQTLNEGTHLHASVGAVSGCGCGL